MSLLTAYVKHRLRKGDAMDLLKFVLGSRYITDWMGLHRRDVAVGLAVLNALISVLTSQGVVAAFPHLAGIQETLTGLSVLVGAGGVLDKAYNNPLPAK